MQLPDSTRVRLHPGVRLAPRTDEPRVALGGHALKGDVLGSGKCTMVATVAKVGDRRTIFYGQLVLCFEMLYLGRWQAVCYVRWLDTVRAVMSTVAGVEGRVPRGGQPRFNAAEQALLSEMEAAPFAAYRWSRATGATASGHPRAGDQHFGVVAMDAVLYAVPMIPIFRFTPDAADPIFFLNSDMWDI